MYIKEVERHPIAKVLMTSTKVLSKMLKPELLRTAKGLDKRVNNQEKATMFLFYAFAISLSAAFIF